MGGGFWGKKKSDQNGKEVWSRKWETRKKTRRPRNAKVTEEKPEEKDERTGQMTEETDLSIFFSLCRVGWFICLLISP